jgi:hypothetical protein
MWIYRTGPPRVCDSPCPGSASKDGPRSMSSSKMPWLRRAFSLHAQLLPQRDHVERVVEGG